MTPFELAQNYMHIVFDSQDMSQLKFILAENLEFIGPLYQFDNANDYINSMLTDPPKDFSYEIMDSYSTNSVCKFIYKFSKPGITTTMTQTFEVYDNKIKRIVLEFDPKDFQIK